MLCLCLVTGGSEHLDVFVVLTSYALIDNVIDYCFPLGARAASPCFRS